MALHWGHQISESIAKFKAIEFQGMTLGDMLIGIGCVTAAFAMVGCWQSRVCARPVLRLCVL